MAGTGSSPPPSLLDRLLAARALSLAMRPDVSASAAAATLAELAKGSSTALSLALARVQCRDPTRTGPLARQAAAALRLAQVAVGTGRPRAAGDDTERRPETRSPSDQPRKPHVPMPFDAFRDVGRLGLQRYGARAPATMPMDVYHQGDHFVVNLDLPGVHPASIDLVVEKNVVTVRAERSWPGREGDDVLAAERPRGIFIRELFLTDTLDPDNMEAHYHTGVLTLTVPKREEARLRRVQVTGRAEAQPSSGTRRHKKTTASRASPSGNPLSASREDTRRPTSSLVGR